MLEHLCLKKHINVLLQCMKVTQSVRIDAFDEKELTEVAMYVGNVEC